MLPLLFFLFCLLFLTGDLQLYLIGSCGLPKGCLLRVNDAFFEDPRAQIDEGFGPFVGGNVLALHREYADASMLEVVADILWGDYTAFSCP